MTNCLLRLQSLEGCLTFFLIHLYFEPTMIVPPHVSSRLPGKYFKNDVSERAEIAMIGQVLTLLSAEREAFSSSD